MTKDEKKSLEELRARIAAGDGFAAFQELRRLKENASPSLMEKDMWQLHELFGAAFFNMADAEGAAAAYNNAAKADRFLSAQRQHFSNYLLILLDYLYKICLLLILASPIFCNVFSFLLLPLNI